MCKHFSIYFFCIILLFNFNVYFFREVFKALNKTRGLYLRWLELSGTPTSNACGAPPSGSADADWTCTELRNALRSIEWDLEDLDDTIDILSNDLIIRD